MVKIAALTCALLVGGASAFAPSTSVPSTSRATIDPLHENFGLSFAEDQAENTPDVILGEANYKQWVGEIQDNSFLNRQYNVLRRVRELDLIGKTAEYGILSKLENLGLDLATAEKLLPVLEETGALSLVGNNQQLLVNLVAPLLIEPAPILLPGVAALLDAGPAGFYALAAASAGLEAYFVTAGTEIPLTGIGLAPLAGLLLIPAAGISAVAGTAIASLKK
jgi:hypothetical protein